MRTLALPRLEVALARRAAVPRPTAGALVIADDALITDASTGSPVALVAVAAPDVATRLGTLLRRLRWAEKAPRLGATASGESRLSGIAVSNSTYGYLPPVPLRRRYGCSRCALDTDRPDLLAILGEFIAAADALLSSVPTAADLRALVTDRIAPAWRMADSPWTSGVINNNTALPYHRDASNVAGSWSALLACKRSCDGGWLHLPAYGVHFLLPNGAIALFDGGREWHGVTPFRLSRPDGYRYTTVAYARAGMAACAPDPATERARAANVAAAAARTRLEARHDR